jgi:hypothetical protein
MIGTRRYPNEQGQLLLAEGEYGKGADDVWYCRPPGNHMGSLAGHEVTEHEDGTISVSPSILIDDGRSKWHGHLVRGEFKE